MPQALSSGGLLHMARSRTLRQVPGFDVRQPDLGSPPRVVSISGFGAGGQLGAGIINNGSDADQSQGRVYVRTGLTGIAGTGTVVLNFPIAPQANQYVIFGSWLASYTLGIAGNQLTINWTAGQTLNANETHYLNYQWAVSQ